MNVRSIGYGGLVRLRALLSPLALFGLVVLGLHAGSDRLDDLAYVVLNTIDRFFDGLLGGLVQAVLPSMGASAKTVGQWTYALASLIDLEEKRWAARVVALAFELTADWLLIWPVLRHRGDRTPWRQAWPSPRRIRNIGAVFAPVAVALAGTAGAVVVAQQAQLQLFWFLRFVGRPWSGRLAGMGALLILGFVLWRLTLPAIRAALAYGRIHADDVPWRRGWLLAGPLFIAALAMAPVPLWRTLRGLGPW